MSRGLSLLGEPRVLSLQAGPSASSVRVSFRRKAARVAQRAVFGFTVATVEDVASGEVVRRFTLPRQPSRRPSPVQIRNKRLWDNFVRSVLEGFFLPRPPVRYESMADLPGA